MHRGHSEPCHDLRVAVICAVADDLADAVIQVD
jgi:hypothetical protein